MAETKTVRINQTRWSSGQDTVKREDFDSDAASLEQNVAMYKEGALADRPAAGLGGRFYTVKGDTNAANNRRQYYDNGIDWAAPSYTNNQLAESIAATDVPLTVRGQGGQTADVLKVRNSAGVDHLRVTSDGYITNQANLGTSSGVRFGYTTAHQNAALFNSVDPNNPTVLVRGGAGQVANLLELRDSNNVSLLSFNRSGGINAIGAINSAGLTSTGAVSAPSLTVNSSASLAKGYIFAPSATDVALSVAAYSGAQNTNLVEYLSTTGSRSARILSDGTFATNGRVLIGNSEGDSGNQTYDPSVAALQVRNNIDPNSPILSLTANPTSQLGKALQVIAAPGNPPTFSVDASGNVYSAGNADYSTMAIGAGATAPIRQFNSYIPRFEVSTGSDPGGYAEAITVRHSANNTSAVSRQLSLQLKLSSENTQVESNKWAGIMAQSTAASAGNVGLSLYTNGSEALRLDADNTVHTYGDLRVAGNDIRYSGGSGEKLYLNGDVAAGTIGMQSANTAYMRADNIAFYSGGTYNANSLNSGAGTTMLSLSSERGIMKRLSLTNPSNFDSASPTLKLSGSAGGHMQFSDYSINVYNDDANTQPGGLNIANNGGDVRLGATGSDISIIPRMLHMGHPDDTTHAILLFNGNSFGDFVTQTGRMPENNDMWFDATNNRIGMHNGTQWLWVHLTESS